MLFRDIIDFYSENNCEKQILLLIIKASGICRCHWTSKDQAPLIGNEIRPTENILV